MDTDRLIVYAVAACIAALTLATGPAGPLALPEPDDGPTEDPGTGNATVEMVSVPDSVTVQSGEQDTQILEISPVVVNISNVRGNPLLDLSVDVEGPNYAVSSATPLGGQEPGRVEVGIEPGYFDADSTQNVTGGTLRLVLRGDTDRTLLERRVGVTG